MSTPYLKLNVVDITRETTDAITLHLEHPDRITIPYQPGQFLTLILPGPGPQGKVRRSYSLSSIPQEAPRLSVTVKRVIGGLVSNHLLDNVKVGDVIEAMAPIGNFTCHTIPTNTRHVVLFGAGSGITPLMSMLKCVLKVESSSKVYLVYGNRNEDSIIFKDQLQQLEAQYPDRLKVFHVLSQPNNASAHAHIGRLNRRTILKIVEQLGVHNFLDTVYYMCGPEGMMEEVRDALKILHVPQDRIHKESFVSKLVEGDAKGDVSTKDDDEIKARTVTVEYEGSEYKFEVQPNQTILEAGLDQGIDLPYSCQSGLCTACRGKCLSGKVHLDEREGLSDMELNEGYVLTCVGHPLTDDVVIEIG